MRPCSVFVQLYTRVTWNLRMSRGFPAFFRQFWLHLRKNFRKNLKEMTKERKMGFTAELHDWRLLVIIRFWISNARHSAIHPSTNAAKQYLHVWKWASFSGWNREHPPLCHLIASPEFRGLSQHPSATNIQEVTWYSTHLFNPRTPPVQLKFSCSIGKQMRPTCDQVLFEEHQG